MRTLGLLQCAGAAVALVTVSACGSAQQAQGTMPVTPSARGLTASYLGKMLMVNGRPVTAERLSPLPRFAQLHPDHSLKNKYEYVFNEYGSYASVFNYPNGTGMVAQIQGLGGQGCTNATFGYGKKIFWNAGRTNDVISEYKVPQKFLRSLPLGYEFTSSCAMNAAGDLAVGVLISDSYGPGGQVIIFKNATGTGKVYPTPLAREFFNGYDDQGNLYANGFDSGYNVALVELKKGTSKFVSIKLPNTAEFPGSVQWDGKYVSMFDQETNETYQYTISGTTATLKNTIQFSGSSDCAQTWIVPNMMYCGDAGNNNGEVFKYPAGGAPIATFTGSFDLPLGVTASKK